MRSQGKGPQSIDRIHVSHVIIKKRAYTLEHKALQQLLLVPCFGADPLKIS